MSAAAAVGGQSRSISLALDLLGVLSSAEAVAEKLMDAAYEEAEPGLVYAARGVREKLREGRGLLEAVLRARLGAPEA